MSEEKLIEGEKLSVEYELPIDTQLTIPVKRKVSDIELKIIDSAVKIINTLKALSYNINIDYSLD